MVDDKSEDMVNSPSHYNKGGVECIDAIRAMLGEDGFTAYCRGNAIKYTWRAGLKFNYDEDLKKAVWYNRMAAGDDPRKDIPAAVVSTTDYSPKWTWTVPTYTDPQHTTLHIHPSFIKAESDTKEESNSVEPSDFAVKCIKKKCNV